MGLAKGNNTRTGNIDWITFSLYLSLILIGWLMIYAVGYNEKEPTSITDLSTSAGRQMMWVGVSLFIMFSVYVIDWKFWRTFSYSIYGVSIVLLVLVLFLGSNIKGATAWFSIGGFSFQPAEIAKFGTSLALSNYMSAKSFRLAGSKNFFNIFLLLGIPVGLILWQPDAGSALVFLSFFILLYREGLSTVYYIIGGFLAAVFIGALLFDTLPIIMGLILLCILGLILTKEKKTYWLIAFSMLVILNIVAGIEDLYLLATIVDLVLFIAIALLVSQRGEARLVMILTPALIVGSSLAFMANFAFNNFLAPHQQDRINVWLHPDKCDPRGSLYNLLQSKMAIGSGGIAGKGFLEGNLTKLNYVPEQSTDFIFCTIGEEHGFIGVIIIIGLFVALLIRLVIIAERQRLHFVRNYAYCIAGIIFVHFFINIGMTMGLLPIIGIPLPFVSYGGSSIIGFTIMLAVLLKLDITRHGGQ